MDRYWNEKSTDLQQNTRLVLAVRIIEEVFNLARSTYEESSQVYGFQHGKQGDCRTKCYSTSTCCQSD